MSKLNKRPPARPAQHVIVTSPRATGRTALGGAGFSRDVQSELYLLGVINMVNEKTFHELVNTRDNRFVALVRQAAVAHPQWTLEFLRWLRQGANMRSAPVVGVAEFIKGRLDAGVTEDITPDTRYGVSTQARSVNRRIVSEVLVRPDEPSDLINYWITHYGRNLPMPLKRGVADTLANLYTEWSLLRYDADADAVRFADVIELTHPVPYSTPDSRNYVSNTSALFKYAIDARHDHVTEIDQAKLPMIHLNTALKKMVGLGIETGETEWLDTDVIKAAGFSWQNVLSMVGDRMPKAKLWEAVIPTMGYQALLMNLRNFDVAKVSDEVADQVCATLVDPRKVARSRMLPMQFLSAFRAVSSLRWGRALNTALELSLSNIPELPGRTLILVDTSGSMNDTFSKDGTLKRWDAAAIFGLALATRCAQADVVSFSSHSIVFPAVPGEALLVSLKRFQDGFFINGGTQTGQAVARHYAGHDRVVVLTDEQAQYWGGPAMNADGVFAGTVPAKIPTYTWNLAGYVMGHAPGAPNRYTFGGLTDAGFKMIPLLESNRDGHWPWETGRDRV